MMESGNVKEEYIGPDIEFVDVNQEIDDSSDLDIIYDFNEARNSITEKAYLTTMPSKTIEQDDDIIEDIKIEEEEIVHAVDDDFNRFNTISEQSLQLSDQMDLETTRKKSEALVGSNIPICFKQNNFPESEPQSISNDVCKFKSAVLGCIESSKYTRKDGGEFLCNQCNYSCYAKSVLSRHIFKVHENSGCDYSFKKKKKKLKPFNYTKSDSSNILSRKDTSSLHIKGVLEKKKLFKCSECPYSATLSGTLRNHVNRVHEKLPYKYNYISIKPMSSQKDNLPMHVKRVRKRSKKEKTLRCCKCDASFSSSSKLTIHLRDYHQVHMPFNCGECDFSCCIKHSLETHIQIVHNKII